MHPPFYYALIKVWFSVVGASLIQAKLVSVLFSVGTLWLTWHPATRWFGRRAGLLALASAALSPYLVYWSHSARNLLVLPFFVTETECILCGICVRMCDEVLKTPALGFVGRGFGTSIAPPLRLSLRDVDFDGIVTIVESCPTGGFTLKSSPVATLKVIREGRLPVLP